MLLFDKYSLLLLLVIFQFNQLSGYLIHSVSINQKIKSSYISNNLPSDSMRDYSHYKYNDKFNLPDDKINMQSITSLSSVLMIALAFPTASFASTNLIVNIQSYDLWKYFVAGGICCAISHVMS